MFSVIPLLLFVSNALALPPANKPQYNITNAESLFSEFVQKYGKVYATAEEYKARFLIFVEHLVTINHLNNIHETAYAVNEYSDTSYDEFKRTRHGGLIPLKRSNASTLVKVENQWIEDAPDSLDYRDQGLVGPARNQGECSSCYAFAGLANIEGQHAKKHKELLSLSVQQGLDCDTKDIGCKGGYNLYNIMNELAKQGGVELEKDYPYEAKDDKCRTDKSKIAVKVLRGFEINITTEVDLEATLAKFGPLSVGIDAFGLPSDYSGGILSPDGCDPNFLNHGVLLVGYGKEAKEGGKDYWIVKNSWGADWGDKGFFYLEKGKGYCGIDLIRIRRRFSMKKEQTHD